MKKFQNLFFYRFRHSKVFSAYFSYKALKMNRNRDIEYEMSRFEEEITKLTPVHTENVVIAAPPVNTITIKTPINFQMAQTMHMVQPQFSPFNFQQSQMQMPPNPFLTPVSIPTPYKPPTVPKIVTGTFNLNKYRYSSDSEFF